MESAKSRAWRAYVLACLACLHAYVIMCLARLRVCMFTSLACLRAYVLGVLTYLACLRGYVVTCLRAWCAWVCMYEHVMMQCFIFLRVCVLGVLFCPICFTFQYLNLKILTAKKKLCALLSWTYFLFTFWYELKQYQFFTIYIFTYYINLCWTHYFCLIYCQSSYWLLLLLDKIP